MNIEERFWAKVDRTTEDGCWLWRAATTGTTSGSAYGLFYVDGKLVLAHRFAYELLVGPIPEGLTLDHLVGTCESTLCVNPDHLEPVTISENIRRARAAITHCPQGHPLSGANLYVAKSGKRHCRTCHRDRSRERRRKARKENDLTPGMRRHG